MKPLERDMKHGQHQATSPVFLWPLHISLCVLSSPCPLTLSHWWEPSRAHTCAAHLCLFSCLRANIWTPTGNNKANLHMPSRPIYVWCNMTYRTSFPQSPQAFPITYLRCALSLEYPLMADWTQASAAVNLQQRRVYKRFFVSVFKFSLSIRVVYPATTPSQCRCHPPLVSR